MNKKIRLALFTLIGLVLVVAIFYGGIQYGATRKSIKITDSRELIDADFSLFWEAVDVIKNKYVDIKNVKDQNLLYGAINGVVGALEDPYSEFFNPGDAKKFNEDITGSFGGIGAELGIRNGQLVIVAPLKGNPAEAVGLKAGDKILGIDDVATSELTLDGAVKLIRGEPDTEVRLLIFRDGWKEAKEFKITRQIIIVPTLDWEMKSDNIAYIALHNFNANVPYLFYRAAFEALIGGADGIVLDLRNNPGGFLEVANDLASWFLKRGDVIVKEQFTSGKEKNFRADGNSALAKIPTVIIVNNGSASASEILAGALRDNRGVKLIGEKTFGKGSVQEIQKLKDGSAIKVSIAAWLTPNGEAINKKGLAPDMEIGLTDENAVKKQDPQLDKAIEVLKSQITNNK